MRSLRSGVATAAIVAMWSSTAFAFNLFGSDKPEEKPKPAPQAQTQAQQQQSADDQAAPVSLAKSLAANLDMEVEKAKTQRALGDNTGAAHALAQMMLVAPDDVRVVGEYGKTLVSLGRSDDAVAFLKRALELNPNDWTLYSAIGAAFDQKADFVNARVAYQRGLQLKPDSSALLNNYAMSRMLAGDLPGAQALIAQAQTAGNDPKIAHNAALMANLRGPHAEQSSALPATQPVMASVVPAAVTAKPAALAPTPVAHAMPKPVSTASLPTPAPIAPAAVKVEPVKAASIPAAPKPLPVKEAAVAKPAPVVVIPAAPKPAPVKEASIAKPAPVAELKLEPVKTASLPAAEKPTIVKTETGRVMMQAVPKDPQAGPVKTAEIAKPEPVSTPVATNPPRTLASAAPVEAPRPTPDLRAASD